MTPEKILADTDKSFSVWKHGGIEVRGSGQTVTLKLSPEDCKHIAHLLLEVAEGKTDNWANPNGPERIAWSRFEGKEQSV